MGEIKPYAFAQVQDFNQKWVWYLNKPPVVLTTLASDLHGADSGEIADGRYHPSLGLVHGSDTQDRQDTAISGTASRSASCRFFTLVAGVADSNWRDPVYHNWGILCNDGSAGGIFDLVADHINPSIETTQMMVWRGAPPYGAGVATTAANCYTAIELCYSSSRTYQILMAFGKPICLQFSSDAGATWTTVAILRSFNRQEVTFTTQDYVSFHFLPNYTTGQLTIDTSAGGVMQHTPSDAFTKSNPRNLWLPALGRFRVRGMNGWSAFTVNGKRHSPAQVARAQSLEYPHPQAANAWMSVNALTDQGNQTVTNAVTASGNDFDWQSQVSLPDAGDGLGSTDPPEWGDGQLIVPPDFTMGVPGSIPNPTIVQLATSEVRITEVMDDNERTFSLDGDITLNNDGLRYGPSAGHLALTLYTSIDNGATLYKRCEAICGIGEEGNVFDNADCLNDFRMRFADRSYQMGNGKDVPIGYELQLDGWAFWSAFRLLCHLAGIHNIHLQRLPDAANIYVPPGGGATAAYPYGKADPTYNGGPILANGTGDNPLHVYGAAMTPWDVLKILVKDESLQTFTGGVLTNNIPYVFGVDVDGYVLCYPFNPAAQASVCGFTDINTRVAASAFPGIPWFPLTQFTAAFSVSQLRSELTLEGQDWLTNELLVEHRDQPASVKAALGFPVRLLARQERWGDQTYLAQVADGLQTQVSLPVAIGAGSSIHVPFIHAGDRVSILHPYLSRVTPIDFYLTSLEHQLREGPVRVGATHFTSRAIANF